MASTLPPHTISHLISQVAADPGLPRDRPTESFWQLPPHSLAEVQSSLLPATTTYAIIGSGVTGCSVAKHLLELSSDAEITVFEARTLTSGATGRNGGLLTSFVPYDFAELKEHIGLQQAVKIGRYAHRTLEKMHQLGQGLQEVSEVRRIRDIVGFGDMESFRACEASIQAFEKEVPDCSVHPVVLSAEEARDKYNMKNIVSAMSFDCGAFWPYRLITSLWQQMLMDHAGRLKVETRTPVTEIAYDPSSDSDHPFILKTPRGTVRAAKVIHATNGYTGHLLPSLRGKIYPLRGTMSAQKSTPSFGDHGTQRAWSMIKSMDYDPETELLETGLYYSNQNPKTRDVFIGGEKAKITEMFVADDSEVTPAARMNISNVLPRYFEHGWADGQAPEIQKIWSGVLGFTGDRLPFVGKVPASISGRDGQDGEWIAAGFNGYGMPQCWSAGEAVAKMLLAEEVDDFLPESYLPTEQRLATLSAETALQRLIAV